jgi:LysR family transcriptional regulator, glycine cleavage system transcriptional activator
MPSTPTLRHRPLAVGPLRAFVCVARHLNFRAAAEELALTQSAVTRQIQALEQEIGVPLFLRSTRTVELTTAGAQLLQAVTPALERVDSAVQTVRRTAGRKSVAVSTWASFASMWLIPRLEAFQSAHPDIDIRIDTSDALIDLDNTDVDLVLRYTAPQNVPSYGVHLFNEDITPVASPWLLRRGRTLQKAEDLAEFALIEASEAPTHPRMVWLTWQNWFRAHKLKHLEPKRWLHFGYVYQRAQAALAGQGVALASLPLVADSLAAGDLMEVLPGLRVHPPMSYWLVVAPRSEARPEVQAFCTWLNDQAALTRAATSTGK